MNITNIGIYDFNESIVASGLPMMSEYSEKWFENEVELLAKCADITSNPHFKRAVKLASNPAGSGHCNFLSGITVSMNVTATNVWWMQMERYHFVQIVSSQSKMHRLRKIIENVTFTYPSDIIDLSAFSDVMQRTGKKEDGTPRYSDEELAYRCPMGLELTARITTNYLALKTIYAQRHNHKLTEWKDFCRFIESLPFAGELITGGNK
jgi:hypothetical protein